MAHEPGTPGSSARSPFSIPGSRASLSIRSKTGHTKKAIAPPSTYKSASIFTSPSRSESIFSSSNNATPQPQSKSFLFADLPSSTQAVVKDGKVIEVLDSDPDDTDSLESLDDFFDRRKTGHTTSMSSTPGDDEAKLETERVKTLSLFTSGSHKQAPIVGRDRLRDLRAKESTFKFNMTSLIDDHFDDQEVENNVRKARADVDAATRAAADIDKPKFDKKMLAAVVTTEEGEHGIARLMDALDRTEALTSQQVFSFFGVNGLNDWQDEEQFEYPFPEGAISDHLWREGDNDTRSRAYLSCYMADIAAKRQMPDEALNWTFENVVLERSDSIRQSYIDCLRSASSSWTRTNVTAKEVQNIFQTLGADNNSIRDSVEVKPRHHLLREPPRRDPKYLLAALDLFQAICPDMDFLALSRLTSMLCRLAIDTELMSDGRVNAKVEETFELLFSLPDIETRSHVAERMLADVGKHLKDPTLQANLLAHIPPKSPLACKVRILLAQVFLLGISTLKKSTFLSPNISLDVLTKHISTSPDFDTKPRKRDNGVDYIALRARTQILDIAISDGARPLTFATRPDEQVFNRAVDNLADAVQNTQVAISDPGASHMTRTEAKDDLRALHARLLFSVRTEVRPKRHIFDGKKMRDADEVKSEEQGKDFMKRFLERRKEKTGNQKLENGAQVDGERLLSKDEKSASSVSSSESLETEKAIRKQLGLSD